MSTSKVRVPVASPKGSPKVGKVSTGELSKSQDEGPWVCSKCSSKEEQVEFVLYYLYRKHMTDVHNEKFDSRMCKFCGHQSNKHNMLMYHQYTRHGIKPPPAYNFPKCNRCPYIALTENLLIKHKLNHTKFDLQCTECKVAFNNQNSLAMHTQITGHTGKSGRHNYDCQYCTKRYHSGSNLFSHIKMVHRDEARRDGIVSIDERDELEEEQLEEDHGEYIVPTEEEDHQEKIKILANIKVPTSNNTSNNTGGDSANNIGRNETVQNSNVVSSRAQMAAHERVTTSTANIENVSGIATSLGLVDIVVLDENQQYILHNDQQLVTQQTLANDQREYIIPDMTEQHTFAQAQNIGEVITSEHNVITQSILNNSDIASTDELVMVLTDHDYNDGNNEILSTENSNIVVLYSHPVDGQQNQFITSQGNLMLNSQTGILEIRNNGEGIESAQDAQIESIEMIQREINSHNMINAPQDERDENVPVSTSPSFGETLTQNQVMLESEYNPDATELMQGKEDEVVQETSVVEESNSEDIDVDRMISIGDKHISQEVSDHVLVLNDCLKGNSQGEPMEIDEECNMQENENQQIQTVAAEEFVSPQEQECTPAIERPEEVSGKSMPEIDMTTEDVVTSESQTEPKDTEVMKIDQQEHLEVSTVNATTAEEYTPSNNENMVCAQEEEGVTEEEEVVSHVVDANRTDVNDKEESAESAETTEVVGDLLTTNTETQNVAETDSQEEAEKIEQAIQEDTTELKESVETHVIESEIDEDKIDDNAVKTAAEMHIDEKSENEHTSEEGVELNTTKDIETAGVEKLQEVEVEESVDIAIVNEDMDQSEKSVSTDVQRCEESTGNTEEEEEVSCTLKLQESLQDDQEKLKDNIQEEIENMEEEIDENVENQEAITEHMDVSEEIRAEEEQAVQIDKNDTDEVQNQDQMEENRLQMEEEFVQAQHEDTIHSQPEEMPSSPVEINLQTEEISSSQIDDENSVQNESADEKFQEEISQSDDKINLEEEPVLEETVMTSGDENSQSQDSQASQYSSSRQEVRTMSEMKKTSSQETKISILNDWDDTEDSQQSDNVSKKAELTVNKLIHDWDDDEEEGHESDN